MLELERVSKQYSGPGEVVRALSDVSLAVGPGELVAVVGPSGSGKTTLLMLAAALLRADAGSVRFDGRDLAGLSADEAADYRLRTVGFVLQTPRLAPMTAAENVALPLIGRGHSLRGATRAAREMLERVGLGRREGRYPHALSGGERQRVAIAQALIRSPRLLLADEPTGALDSYGGDEILALLDDLCAERRVVGVLVTHDPRAAERGDRILELRDGRLAIAAERDRSLGVDALERPPGGRVSEPRAGA